MPLWERPLWGTHGGFVNVVWGIRWDRGDDRGRALLALAVRTRPLGPAAALALRQSLPPAPFHGLIPRLLRGVSGRRQAGVESITAGGTGG
jgi:hypothetical protein